MIQIIKEIGVEVSKPNLFQALVAKQSDSNSRFLKVTFLNEGEKIYIPAAATVTINAQRKDGQSNSFFGETNDDGTVTVPLHSWMLELDGAVNCDISAIDEDDKIKLTSTTFVLMVERAANGDGEISEDPQSSVLISLINEVENTLKGLPSFDSEGNLNGIALKDKSTGETYNIYVSDGSLKMEVIE